MRHSTIVSTSDILCIPIHGLRERQRYAPNVDEKMYTKAAIEIERKPQNMLVITLHNDCTGSEAVGHYDYRVYVNTELIAMGRVEKHKRKSGWQGLIRQLANELER
jgi:hypothetical protein